MEKKQAVVNEKFSSKSNIKEEEYGGIAVVYIIDGSSVESKETPKTSSKLSKCSFGNTVDVKAKNEDTIQNAEDKNEPSNEEALDQVKSPVANFPLEESVKEVMTPPVEEVSKFMLNMQSDFYYEGDVEEGNCELDYLIDEVPFLEGHLGEHENQFPLPDYPLEDELPYFPMETENLILKQANVMETMLSIPSSSGSCKRKNLGGEGDTASSSMLGNKKFKN